MPRNSTPRPACLSLLLVCLLTFPAMAQQPGQEDLDKATELRLQIESPQDLQKVAELCDAAIRKGLSEDDEAFAKQLAAGAMFELASRLSSVVLDVDEPDPRWRLFRHTALQSLEKTLQYDPSLPEAHLMIGRLHALPGGDKERAAKAAEKAVELYEQEQKKEELAKAYVLRGSLQKEAKDQLKDFEKAFEADPTNSSALEGQARVLMSEGKAEEALKVFDKLLETSDDKLRIRMTIAEALSSLERYDEALEQANKAIELDDDNATAYTLRARIHALRDETEPALENLNKALELNPQDLTSLLLRAELHLLEGNYEKAGEDTAALLKARPGLTLGYQLRSRVAAAEAQEAKDAGKEKDARKKFAEASQDLRLLLKHDPNNTQWRLQLAAIYSADDQPRRAIQEIDKVIAKDPDYWAAYRTRGDALLSIGEHARAVADYEKALELQPNNSGVLNNLAWVLSTSPKDDVRDGKRAIELARKACEETDYEAAHILSTLASAYAEIGDFETARKWAAKAVEKGAEDLKDQLQQELDSYQQNKPWRELQETKENPDFDEPDGNLIET